MDGAVKLLKELLTIRSVNGRDDEGAVAEYLCKYFEQSGISAHIQRIDATHANVPPDRTRTIRSEISLTSAARPRIYSSSIAANIWAKLSPVTATAYSALTFCVSMIF